MTFNQSEFEIRCEWGEEGVKHLAPSSDVVIIVDVMSFSTCVDIAVSHGAIVFPYRWRDESARDFADSIGAELAGPRGTSAYSLSPASFIGIAKGTRVVLPSPNGSALTLSAQSTLTLTACLRNCRSVARAAMEYGKQIAIIPAGERWKHDNSLRPALEDWVGAGAVIHHLGGDASPEAQSALAAYHGASRDMRDLLKRCSSGKELMEMGFESDVDLASEVNVSSSVPIFREGAYVQA